MGKGDSVNGLELTAPEEDTRRGVEKRWLHFR
jgi:hypothetical protein